MGKLRHRKTVDASVREENMQRRAIRTVGDYQPAKLARPRQPAAVGWWQFIRKTIRRQPNAKSQVSDMCANETEQSGHVGLLRYWPRAPPLGKWALWWRSCCGWCTPPSRSAPPASPPSISGRSAGPRRSQRGRSTAATSGWTASPALQGEHLETKNIYKEFRNRGRQVKKKDDSKDDLGKQSQVLQTIKNWMSWTNILLDRYQSWLRSAAHIKINFRPHPLVHELLMRAPRQTI